MISPLACSVGLRVAMMAASPRMFRANSQVQDPAVRSSSGVAMVRVPGRAETAAAIIFRQAAGRVYVVTAAHVLGGTSTVEVRLPGFNNWIPGYVEQGTVQSQQGEFGFGVVSLPYAGAGIPMLALRSDSETAIKAGASAKMVGFPGPNRPWNTVQTTIDSVNDRGMIDLKASRSPGFSGGPVLIGDRLVGMVLAGNNKTQACRLTTVTAYLEGIGLLPKQAIPPLQKIDVPEQTSPLPSVSLGTRLAVERDGGERPFSSIAICQPGDVVNLRLFLSNRGPSAWRDPHIHLLLDPRFAYVPDTSYMYMKRDNKNAKAIFPEDFLKKTDGEIVWATEDMGVGPANAVYLLFSVKLKDGGHFPLGQSEVPFHLQVTSAGGGVAVVESVTAIVDRNPTRLSRVSARFEVMDETLKPNVWSDQRAACAVRGDDISYRLILQNVGTVDSVNARVRLRFDNGIEYSGAETTNSHGQTAKMDVSPAPEVGTGVFDLLFPRLMTGTKGTTVAIVHAKLRKDASLNQELQTRAEVFDSGHMSWESRASILVVPARNTLSLKAGSIGTVSPDDVVRVELSLLNGSRNTATDQLVRVELPEDLDLVVGSLQSDGGTAPASEYALFGQGLRPTDAQPGFVQDWAFYVRVRPWSRQIGKLATIRASVTDPTGRESADLPIVIGQKPR